uniref:Uncharacterized protein n=1 Tax=Arundo donax TaxID=35708 RepID=A0A0A9H369_ARUDO
MCMVSHPLTTVSPEKECNNIKESLC